MAASPLQNRRHLRQLSLNHILSMKAASFISVDVIPFGPLIKFLLWIVLTVNDIVGLCGLCSGAPGVLFLMRLLNHRDL